MTVNRMPRLQLGILALLSAPLLLQAQEEEEPELDLSIWDKSVNLRGAFGYKDNVLLSTVDKQDSAFWQTTLDVMLLRADLETGANLTLFLTAEDRRYFADIEVEKEQLVLLQGKYERPINGEWFWSGTAQYMYVDQVFDASATEQLLETLPVKSHNYQLTPAIGRNLPWQSRLELRFVGERQHFNEPLDDYWEVGPQFVWTKSYGNKSELVASYTYDHRLYDSREQMEVVLEGENFAVLRPVPDTSLSYHQNEFEIGLNHSFDEARHWRSRSRFLFEINNDNGTGYYDYNRYRLSQRFGYYGDDWHATIEGRILHYDYDVQPVAEILSDPTLPAVVNPNEIRSNWEYLVAVHAEKNIWRKLTLFGDVEYEVVESNYSLEEYNVTTVMGGVDWEF